MLDPRVLQTTAELADEFPFNLDMNSGNPLGVGWLQSTIGHGVRSSAATAFLGQDTLARKNLDVLIGTRVTRLVQTDRKGGSPVFLGVELAQSASGVCSLAQCTSIRHPTDCYGILGARVQIKATKEVILSAGK